MVILYYFYSIFFGDFYLCIFCVKSKIGNCNTRRWNIPFLEWLGPEVFYFSFFLMSSLYSEILRVRPSSKDEIHFVLYTSYTYSLQALYAIL